MTLQVDDRCTIVQSGLCFRIVEILQQDEHAALARLELPVGVETEHGLPEGEQIVTGLVVKANVRVTRAED